jgi:hypothetical protein
MGLEHPEWLHMIDTSFAWDVVIAALGSEEPEHGRNGLKSVYALTIEPKPV